MFETYATLVGWVISEVTQRTVSTGDKVCNFRIAATERRFNKETQEWVDGERLYASVVCWRKLAEHVSASLFKGDPVVVHGRLYSKEWEKNGEPRSMLEMEARAVGPDLSRCTAMLQRIRDVAPSDGEFTPSAAAA